MLSITLRLGASLICHYDMYLHPYNYMLCYTPKHIINLDATRQYLVFLTFSRAMEEPDGGAAAAANPVPEENGVANSVDNTEVKYSQENSSEPEKDEREPQGNETIEENPVQVKLEIPDDGEVFYPVGGTSQEQNGVKQEVEEDDKDDVVADDGALPKRRRKRRRARVSMAESSKRIPDNELGIGANFKL